MKKEQLKGSAQLLFATLIWGCAFVAQSVGMDHLGPMTFQAIRSILAVLALLPVTALMDRSPDSFLPRWKAKGLWKTGILCGLALFAAQSLQQVGLLYTEPGKAGFITAMYIVLVPVLGLFLGKKCGIRVWLSVALAVGGLYLLSCVGVASVNLGDILILISAGAFAVQIVLIDVLAQELDGIRLNCIQFMVVTVLSALAAAVTETPTWQGVIDCAFFDEKGELILVDYKTDWFSPKAPRAFVEKTLRARHTRQLGYYIYACEVLFGVRPAHTYIYSFALDDTVEIYIERNIK